MIILDTNVLSAVMANEPTVVGWLDRQPELSVWTTSVSVFEIRAGLMIMPPGRRRAAREQAFADIVERDLDGRTLPFDRPAAEAAAILVADRKKAGRAGETRDTMIAGIAAAHRAAIVTRNMRHFDDVGVPVVNPWSA